MAGARRGGGLPGEGRLLTPRIRPIDAGSPAEVRLVAERMRATLVEVLGPERGDAMYTPAWLEARVRFHIGAGAVFVAEDAAGGVVGHTVLRLEREGDGPPFGLFSITYVAPAARGQGLAKALLARGEAWVRAQGLAEAVTYTDAANVKLQRLYQGLGYALAPAPNEFVRLSRRLPEEP